MGDLPNPVLKGLEGEVSDSKVAVPIVQGAGEFCASAFGGGPDIAGDIFGGRPDDNKREFTAPFPFSWRSPVYFPRSVGHVG